MPAQLAQPPGRAAAPVGRTSSLAWQCRAGAADLWCLFVQSARIRFYDKAYSAKFSLHISADQVHWEPMAEWAQPERSSAAWVHAIVEVACAAGRSTGRFVRLTLHDRGHLESGYSIAQIQLLGSYIGVTDLAFHAACVATSSQVSADPSLSCLPDRAVDGDPRTCWAADSAHDDGISGCEQSFTLDLLSDSRITQLHILFGRGYPANLSIVCARSTSAWDTQHTTWETIAKGIRGFAGDEGTVVVVLAEPTCARFIRLLLNGRGNAHVRPCRLHLFVRHSESARWLIRHVQNPCCLKAPSIRSFEALGRLRTSENIDAFEKARRQLYAVSAEEMPNSTKAELIHLFNQLEGTERGGVTQAEVFELTGQFEMHRTDVNLSKRFNVFEFALMIFARLEQQGMHSLVPSLTASAAARLQFCLQSSLPTSTIARWRDWLVKRAPFASGCFMLK